MLTSSRASEHRPRDSRPSRGDGRPAVLATTVLAIAVIGVLAAVGWPHLREQLAFTRLRSSDTHVQDEAAAQLVRHASDSVMARTIEIVSSCDCGHEENPGCDERLLELCKGILVGCGPEATPALFREFVRSPRDEREACHFYFMWILTELVETHAEAVDVVPASCHLPNGPGPRAHLEIRAKRSTLNPSPTSIPQRAKRLHRRAAKTAPPPRSAAAPVLPQPPRV